MLMIRLDAAKSNFFDRQKVRDAMDQETRRALSRFGAYTRQRARHSIRKRRGISPPGSPPYSHTHLLRRFILFSYDSTRKSAVIGPVLLNRGTGEAPRLLEYGGQTTRRTRDGRPYRAHYQARPYMRPAFAEELRRLPAHWRGRFQQLN